MANLKENKLTSAAIQEHCERILYSALEAVDPYRLIPDNIEIRSNCLVIKDRSIGSGKNICRICKGDHSPPNSLTNVMDLRMFFL